MGFNAVCLFLLFFVISYNSVVQSCSVTADCAVHETCRNGHCLKACLSDVECRREEQCKNFACKVNSLQPSSIITNDCTSPIESGHCSGKSMRFGFHSGICEEFNYSGCGGNGNNYHTIEECQKACFLGADQTVSECPPNSQPQIDPTTGVVKECAAGLGTCNAGYQCEPGQKTAILICCSFSNSLQPVQPTGNGQINDSCSLDTQCLVFNSYCNSGKCACKPGSIFDGSQSCARYPTLGEECDAQRTCTVPHSSCTCHSSKCICECMAGYQINPSADKCTRPRVALNGKCALDSDCVAAFSQCSSNKCTCQTGFALEKATMTCIGTETCPYGKPVKKNNVTFQCTLTASPFVPANQLPQSTSGFTDDCDPGQYCVPYYDTFGQFTIKGFCCEIPQPKCPLGTPHAASKDPDFGCIGCPIETHFCHQDSVNSRMSICCVKPCPSSSDIFLDNKCYLKMGFGESCEVDEQCTGGTQAMMCLTFGSVKICSCPPSFINANGYCTQPYCTSSPGRAPWRSADGRTGRCSSSSVPQSSETVTCPNGYSCDQTFGICCPTFIVQSCPSTHTTSGGPCRTAVDCSSPTVDVCYRDPGTPASTGQMGLCCRPNCPPGLTAQANSVCTDHVDCTALYGGSGMGVFCYKNGPGNGLCCSF